MHGALHIVQIFFFAKIQDDARKRLLLLLLLLHLCNFGQCVFVIVERHNGMKRLQMFVISQPKMHAHNVIIRCDTRCFFKNLIFHLVDTNQPTNDVEMSIEIFVTLEIPLKTYIESLV